MKKSRGRGLQKTPSFGGRFIPEQQPATIKKHGRYKTGYAAPPLPMSLRRTADAVIL